MGDAKDIFIAAKRGYVPVVRNFALLDPVRATAWDANENTALHVAASYGHYQVCSVLVHEFHVPVDIRNGRQMTPLHCACDSARSLEMVEWLMDEGAEILARDHNGRTCINVAHIAKFPQAVDVLKKRVIREHVEAKSGCYRCLLSCYYTYKQKAEEKAVRREARAKADLRAMEKERKAAMEAEAAARAAMRRRKPRR